jgi:phosphatidylinositol alpha-1,6-mannosyltransferase
MVSPQSTNVLMVHGLDLVFGERAGFLPAIYRRFVAWARGRHCIDHFIANSRNTAKIASDLGFLPVTAIPLGVSLDRQIEPRPGSKRRVLFLGRVVRRKGAGWFAEHVLPRLPSDVGFDVVGGIVDRSEGEALKANPRVTLWGYRDDAALREQKAGAGVMVMPNLPSHDKGDVEGFGLVALEAAADGIPLVAAETEGLIDAVRHGETGFLAPAGDGEAWARQIIEVLDWDEARRQAFAESASRALEAHYSWSRVAGATLAIYRAAGRSDPGNTGQPR